MPVLFGREWIGNESFRGEVRAVEIAFSDTCARDAQLTGHACRKQLLIFVQYVDLGVGYRNADRDPVRAVYFRDGRPNGSFRGSIDIVDQRIRGTAQLRIQVGRESFSPHDNSLYPLQIGQVLPVHEIAAHFRGRSLDDIHLILFDQSCQLFLGHGLFIVGHADRQTVHQRKKALCHEYIENNIGHRHNGLIVFAYDAAHHVIRIIMGVVAYIRMCNGYAFRLSCRSGSENDIAKIL